MISGILKRSWEVAIARTEKKWRWMLKWITTNSKRDLRITLNKTQVVVKVVTIALIIAETTITAKRTTLLSKTRNTIIIKMTGVIRLVDLVAKREIRRAILRIKRNQVSKKRLIEDEEYYVFGVTQFCSHSKITTAKIN